MKRKLFLFGLMIWLFITNSTAQFNRPIIIDTDGATDDFRAIVQLLAIKEFNILGITTVDGAIAPQQCAEKVINLINYLGRANIPVGVGATLKTKAPVWRDACNQFVWAPPAIIDYKSPDASKLIIDILNNSKGQVEIIALGNLTNIANALKQSPAISAKIKRIVWYNEKLLPPSGTNYERDKETADYVLNTKIHIEAIANDDDNFKLDNSFIEQFTKSKTIFAKTISEKFSIDNLPAILKIHPLIFWDDIIPVYLLYPELFDMMVDMQKPYHTFTKSFNRDEVKKRMLQIYCQTYSSEKNINFEKFPIEPSNYQYDLAPFVDSIVKRYGVEEFKFCALTNEIHGHLGVYSIVGAKMGLKAREILDAEIDRMTVLTYAGRKQPLSCMNDGLQVSTGATLGLDMIKIAPDSLYFPKAEFTYKGKTITIQLKEKYQNMVDKDFGEAIMKYGLLTSGYWKAVRIQAIKYWLEWDRNEIFDIKE